MPEPTNQYCIGIDLGGTNIKGVALTLSGEQAGSYSLATEDMRTMNWTENVRSLLHRIEADQGYPSLRIGIAAPGLAAPDNRSIFSMPGRLQGLEGLIWQEFLNCDFPVPTLNDAHAALLGEQWKGAARGYRNALILTLGTGVGGAALIDGHLLQGRLGRAGHLGHTSLDPDGELDVANTPGSLEGAISNSTLASRSGGRWTSTKKLVEAHLEGNAVATELWLKSVKYLAASIASFINAFDPEVIVIGGGIARAGNCLFDPLNEFLDRFEWRPAGNRVKITRAELGDQAGAYGAATFALNQEPQ